ncbi:unnamed protein product, partial [Musa hybrid cultivar]
MLASLSTGWCDDGSRCSKNIKINANGQTVLAKVMDECDSLHGCDQEHAFQPPCAPDIVDASRAVWEALGIPESQIGDDGITCSMASLAIVLHVCAGNYCSRYPLTEPPCTPSGYVRGNSRNCTTQDPSDCCKEGELYPQYQCSPPVTGDTPAHMTIASFAKGGDGGGPAECDGRYHSDDQMLASLSTGWYDDGSRCNRSIRISGNGRSVLAKVVDECDSVYG